MIFVLRMLFDVRDVDTVFEFSSPDFRRKKIQFSFHLASALLNIEGCQVVY